MPLAQRKGIHEVNVRGANDIQLSIAYHPERLTQYGISTASITETLSREFATRYPGALFQGAGQKFWPRLKIPSSKYGNWKRCLLKPATTRCCL